MRIFIQKFYPRKIFQLLMKYYIIKKILKKIRNQNILIPIQNQNQKKNFYNKISPKKLKKNNSKNYENIKEYFINKNLKMIIIPK